ncbi:hypothetical protein PT974_09097 [Cladobotryum mycophilum]|uniref:Methyltransferase domain-containing protein n=1 Tax=Cladobotryum mycophilum TaxID=491253 RepID=A0ABR0SFA0_9HYPO
MTQYDSIGSQYEVIKMIPQSRLEQFNFRRSVQPFLDVEGTTVIDYACGMDISPAMVKGAVSRLSSTPFADRARFLVGDGTKIESYVPAGMTGFDIATGAWFLNYAKDLEELTGMFRSIATNLTSDGTFVGICLYATDDISAQGEVCERPALRKTGVKFQYEEELENGQGHRLHVIAYPPPRAPPHIKGVDFFCYHLKRSIYEEAARAGGLTGKLEWRKCIFLGEDWRWEMGLEDDEEGWRAIQDSPRLSILVVRKT